MNNNKIGIFFVQLGSPKSPKVGDVRHFLKNFLGDPRVVDMNPWAWKIILNVFVLPFRPYHSANLYSRIWDGDGFPLIKITDKMVDRIKQELRVSGLEVKLGYILSPPQVNQVLQEWQHRPEKIFIIPLFPQYSESTSASVFDCVIESFQSEVVIPEITFIPSFYKMKSYIDHSCININRQIDQLASKTNLHLVISFHGIPKRRIITKHDPYYQQCFETFSLIKKGLKNLTTDKIHMTFQSRFGSEEWLTPYTEKKIEALVVSGVTDIAIYSPSFVVDCLETLDELGHELKGKYQARGCDIHLVPCLNDELTWCQAFARDLELLTLDNNNSTREYSLTPEEQNMAPEQKMESPPLSKQAKKTLGIVFLTLFMDLVGFSIIFPLFPSLAKHYLEADASNPILRFIFDTIHTVMAQGGDGALGIKSIVLFGGALGALYSFLQFLAAPFWGIISDRIGRRPVLLISVAGLTLSYLLWFFSGSFTLLIVARIIGGIMGGNISTATAVVADITEKSNRSKGMAIIGIAFATGFIIGPAMGGILSIFNLLEVYPGLADYGVNPFSLPALLAFILSLVNLLFIYFKFKETLPVEKRGKAVINRSANLVEIFKPLPHPGVNLTNFGHFLFLVAFSGMEFTLTFLAVERLNYSSMDNAYMFIFIGFVIALVQGGIVRRQAGKVGEKKMVLIGLMILIPGLLIIGSAHSSLALYAGLLFLATGSSLVIPCMTSLVSIYTPADVQGKSIGIFRSLGALARVFGPLLASLCYWRLGASYPYILGAIFLLLPVILTWMLPEVKKQSEIG